MLVLNYIPEFKCLLVCKSWFHVLANDFNWFNTVKMKSKGPFECISMSFQHPQLVKIAYKLLIEFPANQWKVYQMWFRRLHFSEEDLIDLKTEYIRLYELSLEKSGLLYNTSPQIEIIAAAFGHLPILSILNVHSDVAIEVAATEGHLDCVKYLINQDVSIPENALILAAYRGHEQIVNFLLDAGNYYVIEGANIHAKEDSALAKAASAGHISIVQNLLRRGANVFAKDSEAYRLACYHEHDQIINLLAKSMGAIPPPRRKRRKKK